MIFDEIINSIENEDIKSFGSQYIETICPYFWEVPASSSLKYHPAYACTIPFGLAKHTVAVVRFLNHMFGVESIANQFTSRERDLLRVAALAHDSLKSGTQADYEKSKYTKFDHPLLAANKIRSMNGLDKKELEFIAHAIESHMGAFNTDKRHPDIILPKPQDKYQIILHLADYLASRKDIEMKFDNYDENNREVRININTWRFPWGKNKGKTLQQTYDSDVGYLEWCMEHLENPQVVRIIKEFLDNK